MKISNTVLSFIFYGIIPFTVILMTESHVKTLAFFYDPYYFLLFAMIISLLVFMGENSRVSFINKISIILSSVVVIMYIFYIFSNAHISININGARIQINYSLIILLFFIPATLKIIKDILRRVIKIETKQYFKS